uniref:Poly A polymerase head domain-containing protein n=1 Tax=Trieres chinensis TaxID=1514140 RepID=A0A7S2EN92_TRICV|mmetsp:Transcript_30547/g.62301  ORF Transcript_30547/g.62301 Transcript_30547/m.62301 type:complete len:628 (+) Transcript_30547:1267-3150(+)
MYSVHDEIDPMPLGLERLTSKFKSKGEGGMLFTGPSMGRKGGKLIGTPKKESADGSSYRITDDGSLLKESHPVDIDIALDDMLGREFADRLNDWLVNHGREAHSVGVVLKNPEKSKHLETATMKVGEFWIDFVNLRAEEYTEDSRIPDLMRIGTAEEDAYRRDLTINALFYNVNTGRVEDWTGRGFADLARGAVATPLPPLTTLLDDPLRVLRSVRFAARLRFAMDTELREAARDVRVRRALAQKVARERVGAEVDLMLRSKDPVGAMRLLVNLRLAGTVFPIEGTVNGQVRDDIFDRGLTLLSATHDHLLDCKLSPPAWCNKKRAAMLASHGACERMLMDDEEARRFLWYAAFLKPFRDCVQAERAEADEREGGARMRGKKANRSAITRLMVDELKRPARDAEASEKIMKAADQFTDLMRNGGDLTVAAIAMREMRVKYEYDVECDVDYFLDANGDCFSVKCTMLEEGGGATKTVDVSTETDPVWKRAMEFRLKAAKILDRVGPLWRAALILSLSARLAELTEDELNSATERDILEQDFEEMRLGVVERHDAFAASLLNLGLIGIWYQQPLLDGGEMKGSVLSGIPKGPAFREVMEEQGRWMLMHPGGTRKALADHMRKRFPDYVC